MKRLTVFLLTLLTLVLLTATASAQVVPCVPPPPCQPDGPCPMVPECIPPRPWGVSTNPEWLKIDHHRVNVEIENQIARTSIDMEFENDGFGLAEGTFVFPIPLGASVEELVMYINGTPIEAQILEADQARGIYNEIVRQYRDPALLEYVGQQAIQANVFPIPPGESRRITITYSQILEADNGLIHYVYPLAITELMTYRPVEEMSVHVNVNGQDQISSIYSPSHDIVINRDSGNTGFEVGYEQSYFVPDQSFELYYGLETGAINVNMLTYRESADGSGYFMLLVQPPLSLPQDQIIPRDVIIVLDQSGSMDGEKWDQAREAAAYVLDHLNERDRFNVVLFSTGWRVFSNELEAPSQAADAVDWINSEYADGGTNIDGALATALDMVDSERQTTILFLTDGLPTEGEVDTQAILDNVDAEAHRNVHIFAFGVGDDVDTVLLDSLVRDHRGTSSYVRPTERVDEVVASLYNKISAPVLTDVQLEVDGVTVEDLYPQTPLPDLFAGEQLTLVGRYRGSADNVTLRLSGVVNGEDQTFVYDGMSFRDHAGGESFIPRLWATRRIGDLLNSIRLNGENPEVVDSIISLSIRYGIITPYTSFLIDENDILSQTARSEAAQTFSGTAGRLAGESSGAGAVAAADQFGQMQSANAAPAPVLMPTLTAQTGGFGGALPSSAPMDLQDGSQGIVDSRSITENPIQTVGDKTFIQQNGVWTDTTFQPDTMTTTKVAFLSDEYFALIDQNPVFAEYFAVGDRLIVVVDNIAYEVTNESS
ncbi:MAG: VWA domain-containing protein [Anaerolineae bacterium]